MLIPADPGNLSAAHASQVLAAVVVAVVALSSSLILSCGQQGCALLMKTFSELVHDERSAASMARRRDQRNEEHKLTKAQREIQDACCYGLAHHVAYIEACSQLVATGELHPLEHPLAAYYAELRREQLLSAQHPATVPHPLVTT